MHVSACLAFQPGRAADLAKGQTMALDLPDLPDPLPAWDDDDGEPTDRPRADDAETDGLLDILCTPDA